MTNESGPRLSESLRDLVAHADGRPLSLGEVVTVMGERGHALVMGVLAFPFLLPVPTMGLSAPAGFAIAVVGLCVAAGVPPWLPGPLARKPIAFETLSTAATQADRLDGRLQRWLRPRLAFVMWPGMHLLLGLGLALSGVALGLPIPLPLANAIPAAAILLYCAGLLERDGAFILAGHAVVAAFLALAVLLWDVVSAALLRVLPFLRA
jgi:hypothetical protein